MTTTEWISVMLYKGKKNCNVHENAVTQHELGGAGGNRAFIVAPVDTVAASRLERSHCRSVYNSSICLIIHRYSLKYLICNHTTRPSGCSGNPVL